MISLSKLIEEVLKEIEELEEDTISTTGNIAGYDIPGAFAEPGSADDKKRRKRSAVLGYTVVDGYNDSDTK